MPNATPAIPVAKRVPTKRVFHGDTFVDDYEWMREKTSADVQQYVAAQNEYCEARNAHMKALRDTLFNEFKNRIEETDMSVPTRMNGYWYFARTQEGKQYGMQCRVPVTDESDWTPPTVSPDKPFDGEEVVFDANAEAEGHDFFRVGGMDVSKDGRWLLFGVDYAGSERYNFRIRDLHTGELLPDAIDDIGGACLTPDAAYVFWVEVDDAWRPCAIWRHKVGTAREKDVCVYREDDEHFWVGVGISFDEQHIVISTGSKTTSEVWMLDASDPEGEFQPFIRREEGVEYDVSFARFEGAGESGEDIPLAVVYHNAKNPNFEIDVIDMRSHEPPYQLGEGVCVAAGSPYGCEHGDDVEPGASAKAIATPYTNPANPDILQGARGLGIEGIALHEHFVSMSYRAEGLTHLAMMTKTQAAEDFLAGRPWQFTELTPPPLEGDDGTRLYSIGAGGNPSYEAPRMRYSFSSYTRPGELHEIDPATGEDVLLKRAKVLGDFNPRDYTERLMWITARDGESVPASLVYRRDHEPQQAPMFITGYGAYEISSDPGFSVGRLSLLDRGVLYVTPHIRGGGEMGRAWYEQGRRLNKKHTFEDFVDVTRALQEQGLADPQRTVANGGSAGGLLMGAVANMAPECFAGIEADVPFVDALTSILDPSLPLTVTEWDEWGDPLHDAEVYRYMKTYTPYENVPESGTFPRIFITTSMNDTRVLYVEPLKWLALLQSRGFDAIAKIEVEAGHGGISGRYKRWEELAYENAWCLDAMGITE